jgi:hypothetical protein
MAKAQTKPTPVIYTWPRDNILSLLREICGSRQQGERWLAGLIAAKRVHIQLMDPVPPDEDLENFWQGEPPEFDFVECTATKMVVYGTPGVVPGAMGLAPVTVVFKVVIDDIENAAIEDGLIAPPTSESRTQIVGTKEDGQRRVTRNIKAALPTLSRNGEVLYPGGQVSDEMT